MPDSNITLRSVKGSALSHSEMDANFREFFYSASVSGSEVRLYRSQSANPFELINLSEPKGPQYAIQLKRGTAETGASIDFTGSKSLTYDFSSSVLEVTGSSFFSGDMTVDGAITANTFISDTVIEGITTGSTSFGKDKSEDKHFRTGSMFVDGDFDITGRISSAQPITASIDFSNIISKPTLVSGSEQISIANTTGFVGFNQSISSSIGAATASLSASTHTQRTAISGALATTIDNVSSSAHTSRGIITTSVTSLSSSAHTAFLKNTTDTFTGDLTVTGFVSASQLHTVFVTSSIALITGSNKFGDEASDNHSFTGSVNISGSQSVVGPVTFNNNVSVTGDLDVTGTINATISGSINQATTASFAQTASHFDIVNDITPQLGGNLDLNSSNISGSGAIDITGNISSAGLLSVTGAGTSQFSSHLQSHCLGIGTTPSGVAGEIRATGDITAFYSSDERLKDNITPLSDALNKINQIGGYEFDWNSNSSHSGHDVGVIAQEIEKVLPEVVVDRDTGYKAVRYEKIVALLIQAIKEQQLQIDELKSKI